MQRAAKRFSQISALALSLWVLPHPELVPARAEDAPCDPSVSGSQCALKGSAESAGAMSGVAVEAPGSSERDGGSLPVEAIERIVHDYLIRNPQVIREAMQALQAQERAQQDVQDKAVIAQNAAALFNDPDSVVGGNANGAITIVEFFDYRCGYCRRVSPVVAEMLARNQDVRIVYKEFPILGEGSVVGARAALAARAQGRYHDLHGALMRAEGPLNESRVLSIASAAGLDAQRLSADMNDPAVTATIERNHELARALGISGTPAFIIGDRIVRGAPSPQQLNAMVAELRNEQRNAID